MMMPSGFSWTTKPLSDGSVTWWLKRFGKDLKSGSAETKKAAEVAVKKAIGDYALEVGKNTLDRSRLQMAMKRYLERRVYLVSYVFNAAIEGLPVGDILAGAEAGERDWHDREEKRVGFAFPVPTHHRTKPAHEAAEAIIKLMRLLGLNKREKVFAYARKHIGTAFVDGGGTEDIAALEEAAIRAQKEDDARGGKKVA